MLSSSYLAKLVITRGIEEKIFQRLGDPMYTTRSRTVVLGFCLSRVYSNSPLLWWWVVIGSWSYSPASRSSVISIPNTVFFPNSASHVKITRNLPLERRSNSVSCQCMNFVFFRISHNISGQILDPDIHPPDPGYGGQYILVFQPPPSSFGK